LICGDEEKRECKSFLGGSRKTRIDREIIRPDNGIGSG
jgi:hypothetical protein